MATVTQVLRYVVEADTKSGVDGFKKVDAEASGAAGKLQGLIDKSPALKNALGGLGVDAGMLAGGLGNLAKTMGPAVLGAVVTKGIGDFQALAGDVLAFQRIAGTTADESSRWVEVLGDYGLTAEQGAASIGKFAKVIGTTPDVLARYGVEIQKNKDGTVDLNGTLLEASDVFRNTTDETKRAALGAALFGKSWQDLVPVLEKGSGEIRDALGSVAQGKLLSEQDLKDAEDFRLAIDGLKDVVESLSVTVGKELVPQLKDLAEVAAWAGGVMDNEMTKPLIKLYEWVVMFPVTVVKKIADTWGELRDKTADYVVQEGLAKGAIAALAEETKRATDAAAVDVTVTREQARLKGEHADVTEVLAEKQRDATKVQENAERAAKELTKALEDQKRKNDDLYQSFLTAWSGQNIDLPKAIDDTKTALLDYQDAAEEAEKATREHGASSEEAQRAQLKLNEAGRGGYEAIQKYAQVALETEAARRGVAVDALTAAEKVSIQKQALEKLKGEVPAYTGAIDEVSKSMDGVANAMDTAAGKTEDAAKRIATAVATMRSQVIADFNAITSASTGLTMIVANADRIEESLARAARTAGSDAVNNAINGVRNP